LAVALKDNELNGPAVFKEQLTKLLDALDAPNPADAAKTTVFACFYKKGIGLAD
jgi:hypothetical protein